MEKELAYKQFGQEWWVSSINVLHIQDLNTANSQDRRVLLSSTEHFVIINKEIEQNLSVYTFTYNIAKF